MKVFLIALTVSAFLFSSYSAESKNLKFVNNTGLTITQVLMSYYNTEKWGNNLLSSGNIIDKHSYRIQLDSNDARCFWDFKLYDNNNKEFRVKNVNICSLNSVVAIMSGSNIVFENMAQHGKEDNSGLNL